MALSTPSNITALPSTITVDVTEGFADHIVAVYSYLKTLAGDINTELNNRIADQEVVSPVASMKLYASDTIPTGWLVCQGQAVSRTTYANLFAAISTVYGNGDGSTTFNVPNLQGRMPIGREPGGDTDWDTLGELGGTKTHALVEAELPGHTHGTGTLSVGSDSHGHTFAGKGDASASHSHNQANTAATGGTGDSNNGTVTTSSESHSHSLTGSTGATGGSAEHANMPPFQVVNFIIKV